MHQAELDRAVAHATGESVTTIRRLGFMLDDLTVDRNEIDTDLLNAPIIDWDAYEVARYTHGATGSDCESVALNESKEWVAPDCQRCTHV